MHAHNSGRAGKDLVWPGFRWGLFDGNHESTRVPAVMGYDEDQENAPQTFTLKPKWIVYSQATTRASCAQILRPCLELKMEKDGKDCGRLGPHAVLSMLCGNGDRLSFQHLFSNPQRREGKTLLPH
jgi:hypothetical protein